MDDSPKENSGNSPDIALDDTPAADPGIQKKNFDSRFGFAIAVNKYLRLHFRVVWVENFQP